MARARNIKPSFFTNDVLADCPALARLLFAGLWTIADREGRLEDRPKKIKAEVLPYDDCDINELLSSLSQRGFILRYKGSDNNSYIQIVNFTKHQNPHQKEGASSIPAPDKSGASTVQNRNEPGLNPYPLTPIPHPDPPIPSREARARKTPQLEKPHDVSETVWKDFNALRKTKKAPVTETALNGIRKEADLAGISLDEALREVCSRGWQGFKADWYLNAKGNGNAGNNQNGKTGNVGFQNTGKGFHSRGKGYSIQDALDGALADKTRRPEGREERLAHLGINPD